MKELFATALIIVLLALDSVAAVAQTPLNPGQVRLAWDSVAAAAGYRLYAFTNSWTVTNLSSAPVRIDAGTNLTAIVEAKQPGLWRFVATTYNGPVESVPSSETNVTFTAPPANLRTVTVQWSGQVGGTNWIDAVYLKLKLGD